MTSTNYDVIVVGTNQGELILHISMIIRMNDWWLV